MKEFDNHIKRVNGKLQLLVKQYLQLQAENTQLKKQLSDKASAENSLHEKIAELEQKVQLLKAATGQMEGKDKQALEKNINRHLKEIDRCITFLSE